MPIFRFSCLYKYYVIKKSGAEPRSSKELITVKNQIAEKVVAKLEAQEWIASAHLWDRVPGKERIYFELKSKEAIEELSGSLCSKRTFEKIESSWLDAERFSLRGGLENGTEARYGEISATAKAVLAIVAEAKAEVEAEAATSEAKHPQDLVVAKPIC